jgi:adenylosuccinate lyase
MLGQAPEPYSCISPIDFRYWDEKMAKFLSEDAFTRYKLRVELALVTVLCRFGLCDQGVVDEIAAACGQVTTAEVYAEEGKTRHDIRALVNCIQRRVSPAARPFVHRGMTSYDVVDTANAGRYRDAVRLVLLPELLDLESVLIEMVEREAETLQIGRTHGQHAVPITFGFALAEYVSRLGGCILELEQRATRLPGKFSGAVGAYNASSLFFDDPRAFEAAVLEELGLTALDHSTQIVQPEQLVRLMNEIITVCGVMANLADDMRHLQRTEIGEVGEEFRSDQVGSSTMPQKRNPINFENVKSLWEVVMPRMMTIYMNQISEHQRDLTNSASGRTFGEIIAYAGEMATRLGGTMSKLRVDNGNLAKNLAMSEGMVLAEPMYLILASIGHPDAHEAVKQMTLAAQRDGQTLAEVFEANDELVSYREQLTDEQRRVLADPTAYTGRAAERARGVAATWRERTANIRAQRA